nr:MAG TPA: minor tail protein [Bacteriophage sp.]
MGYRKFPDIRVFDWESEKELEFNTQIARSGSGSGVRTYTSQLVPIWHITASYSCLTDDEVRQVLGFVALIRGAHDFFYWLDPEDNSETGIQLPSLGSGSYQAVMQIGPYTQAAKYIEDETVYINGVKQTADKYSVSGGVITFATAPADTDIVTADYTYYWLVMLEDDKMTIQHLKAPGYSKSKEFTMVTV